MSPADLDALLKVGCLLALDTNAAWSAARVRRLSTMVRAVNRLRGNKALLLFAPTLVHAELLHDIRGRLSGEGEVFDPEEVAASLQDMEIEIAAFERADAEGTAEYLHGQHPSGAAWQQAKLEFATRKLSLPAEVKVAAKTFPATVDWFIAGQASARGWLLVTEDGGAEFRGVSRATLEQVEASLRRQREELDPTVRTGN
ncbi:MAG: hypothetical protein KC549_01380 [Myxococcales bacterium]|nr:hypothetical protein [Myxococcales bacterium]